MLPYLSPHQLTVLNYHRIDDPLRAGFDSYKPTVSATPAAFRQQMEYLKRHFHIVTLAQLAGWLRAECELPPRAALITFDDGYSDNFSNAYPVLRSLGLPATIFLCTGCIGAEMPLYWDVAAYSFLHTVMDSGDLPLIGRVAWTDSRHRDQLVETWVEKAKTLVPEERQRALEVLAKALAVTVPDGAFKSLYLNWDQVRELSAAGLEMCAHTVTHPILTRVSQDRAYQEISDSKKRIEAEVRTRVVSFAYPNGGAQDFSPEIMRTLSTLGFELAFTLLLGPTRYRTVKAAPLAVRRISIGHHESFARFTAKLAGYGRLKDPFRSLLR